MTSLVPQTAERPAFTCVGRGARLPLWKSKGILPCERLAVKPVALAPSGVLLRREPCPGHRSRLEARIPTGAGRKSQVQEEAENTRFPGVTQGSPLVGNGLHSVRAMGAGPATPTTAESEVAHLESPRGAFASSSPAPHRRATSPRTSRQSSDDGMGTKGRGMS